MTSNNTDWLFFTFPIAYTGAHYYGVASSAFDGYNICFGGEHGGYNGTGMTSYGVLPSIAPPYSDTIAINWHCIGW